MYDVSDAYIEAAKASVRAFKWYGTITTVSGQAYAFGMDDLVSGKGELIRQCSGDTALEIGTAYVCQLTMALYLDMDRYALYGAEIALYFSLRLSDGTWEEVPCGTYLVSECGYDSGVISIVAYDFMSKLSAVPVTADSPLRTQPGTLWEQLLRLCALSGLTLGISREDCRRLPNGTRTLSCSDAAAEGIETARDVLGYLAQTAASFALVDRGGALTLGQYTMEIADTIPDTVRFTSNISDFISYYTGMYSTYTLNEEAEYAYHLAYSAADDGLVYDLGVNPYLQVTDDTVRARMADAIISALARARYVPFEITMPINPAYDPGDVLRLSGAHAGENDLGAITRLSIPFTGAMTIRCAGENPRLSEAAGRVSQNLSGLTNGGSGGGDVWMRLDTTTDLAAGDTEAVANEIAFTQSGSALRIAAAYTAAYTLTETRKVTARILLDEEEICRVTDTQSAGARYMSFAVPYLSTLSGDHTLTALISSDASTDPLEALAERVAALEEALAADDTTESADDTTGSAGGYDYMTGTVAFYISDVLISYGITGTGRWAAVRGEEDDGVYYFFRIFASSASSDTYVFTCADEEAVSTALSSSYTKNEKTVHYYAEVSFMSDEEIDSFKSAGGVVNEIADYDMEDYGETAWCVIYGD